jgi:hypothetical protein
MACNTLEAMRDEFLYRADLIVESAACVLSYPKLPPEPRSRITEVQRLVTLISEEVNRLEATHQAAINEYVFALHGLRPGMVIRPAKKPRDRRIVVSRYSIDDDGILIANGWRVDGVKSPHSNRRWDSVKLIEGLWRVEPGEPAPSVSAQDSSYPYPRSRHDKSWGMLVDSTPIGAGRRATACRRTVRGILSSAVV